MASQYGVYKVFFENYDVNFAKKMAFHLAAFINLDVQDAVMALDKEVNDICTEELGIFIE